MKKEFFRYATKAKRVIKPRSTVWPVLIFSLLSGVAGCGHENDTSAPVLELAEGSRIALVGGGLASRMNFFGHFEAELHCRYPELNRAITSSEYNAAMKMAKDVGLSRLDEQKSFLFAI